MHMYLLLTDAYYVSNALKFIGHGEHGLKRTALSAVSGHMQGPVLIGFPVPVLSSVLLQDGGIIRGKY